MSNKDKLNIQQQKFVDAYIENGGKPIPACETAGYKQPHVKAYQLLKLPKIKEAIDERREEIMVRLGITPERTLAEFACSAFVDPIEFFDESGNLKKLKEMPESARRSISSIKVRKQHFGEYDKDGKKILDDVVEVKLNDKTKNLENISKHLGLFEKDNEQRNPGDAVRELLDMVTGKSSSGGLPVNENC
jgi:phage terminase small subunit